MSDLPRLAASPTSLEALLTAVDSLAPAQLEHLAQWVEINSFSRNRAGCERMGAALAEAFALPGLAAQELPSADPALGSHWLFTTPAFARGDGVLLIGHHDTVFPAGTFEGYRTDGERGFGPGVLDMKGGLSVIWRALAAAAATGELARWPLAFVSVSDEEIGSPDSASHLRRVAQSARAALVFEAGREADRIVTRRKGTGKLRMVARGKAAHAGNNLADGINAIAGLARWIDQVQALTNTDTGVSVNVGLVHGGTSANTVPAEAWAELDLRFVRQPDGEALVDRLIAIAREVSTHTGVTFDAHGGIARPALEPTDATARVRMAYATAAMAEGLGGEEAALMGGGSDANTVAAVGLPAIDGLGPRGRGFHTHDEWIELASLHSKTRALVRYLHAACAPAPTVSAAGW